MAYAQDEKGDIVINGFEKGIAPSPHKGIANLQSVNISTEESEVMCSYGRVLQSQAAVGNGVLTQVNTNTVSFSNAIKIGSWITILVDSGTGLSGSYYVESVGGVFKLSATFAQDNSTIVTGITSGTATYSVLSMGKPIQSATEPYFDQTETAQTRYYVLDEFNRVWVHDTFTLTGIDTPLWFLPEQKLSPDGGTPTGFAVLNGWLMQIRGNVIFWKSTMRLGGVWSGQGFNTAGAIRYTITDKFHATLFGHQNTLYYTDGNYIGSIFPNNSALTGGVNIQSYCVWTPAGGPVGFINNPTSGSFPYIDGTIRVPVIFYTSVGGTLPSSITSGTVYYIAQDATFNSSPNFFYVYTTATGGSKIADIATGATGTQFFDMFAPVNDAGIPLQTFTKQALSLPFNEVAQALAELGNNVVVGGIGNVLYPWNQIDLKPSDLIPLPENNVSKMMTVNNMLYVFAGSKGNIYITNGSSASLALSVPDYCAGIAGTPSSYIEPYFTWGGVMYLRGRVYFSILDQTAAKAGNCGGIWSFIPTNNFYIGQDTGLSLRLENFNSYGTYNGYTNLLLASLNQVAIAPQYWGAWTSSISGPTYGIDFTDTIPCTTSKIETDIIPTGTFLQKKTFSQIEYKLSTPLAAGETVTIGYRQNSTDAFTSLGSAIVESTTGLSGYYNVSFQKGQWLQLQITLAPLANSSSSFCRLREVRIR